MSEKVHPLERLRHGLPNQIRDKDQLHEALRVAMELELSTIPPYLTALYSIVPDTNEPAYRVIQSVVIEEMLHLTLAGNVLNATSGAAAVDDREYVPQYPTLLPHSSAQFVVPLAGLSPETIQTFLDIEHPGSAGEPPDVEGYHDIGQFYAGIEEGLEFLCAQQGPEALYDGDPAMQVHPSQFYGGAGEVIVVAADGDEPELRHKKALQALREIVKQGEGRSPGSVFDGDVVDGQPVPAHFFRFDELMHGRYYTVGDKPGDPTGERLGVDFASPYTKRAWPEPPDPHVSPMEWYRDNGYTDIADKLLEFNRTYMALLEGLQRTFSGDPDHMMRAVVAMYDLKYQAQALLRTPDPDQLTSVGPSFEFVDERRSRPTSG